MLLPDFFSIRAKFGMGQYRYAHRIYRYVMTECQVRPLFTEFSIKK